ncbi:hypothetical protein R0131_02370 [Clostridium sp. AL.422]|uniref:hypothetical protein n=1 Tax=Clostridium TaxID=1485 RepID=UPI00293DA9F0|nr:MULTISPECIES: hypothetical protein [unclassified Clostridium]MDV4149671.1 hypothetical protein [Clostridium sp. AL.422]
MNILFSEETKSALLEILEKSENNNIRVKVARIGCGKPAYDIYADYASNEDIQLVINDISFVIAKKDEKFCNGIEIKYDKEIYNNGFYIRSL